ncbi:MAG: dihydropteridine reductase, partial [Acutalibacteraceae bacterium]
GVGMCLSMKVIGSGTTLMTVLGIIIGIIGFFGMGLNYPIYKKILEKGKQKYAFEIIELAKEISEK